MNKIWLFVAAFMINGLAFVSVDTACSQEETVVPSVMAKPQALNSADFEASYTILHKDALKLIEKRQKESETPIPYAENKKGGRVITGSADAKAKSENSDIKTTGIRRSIRIKPPEAVNASNTFLFNDVTDR